MSESSVFKILGINHLGIAARDPDGARHFFSEVCGLADLGTDFVADQKVHTHMFASQNQSDTNPVGARLEILDPKDDTEGVIPKYIQKKGGGIHHVALTVDSVKAAIAGMLSKGIQMVDTEPSRYSLKDSKICYETAIARFPNDPEAYESLGFWYDIQNEFALAETCFRNAMERSNSDSPVLGLARVLAQMGRRSEALAALTQCSSPELPEAISLTEEIRNGDWSP